MTFLTALTVILSFGAVVYLIYALIRPERF